MKDYWNKRLTEDEKRAQQLAQRYIKESEKLYKELVQEIEDTYNKLYAKLERGENLTRSELWRYKHYQELERQIDDYTQKIGRKQISLIENAIEDVYRMTIGEDIKQKVSLITKKQVEKILNSKWSGKNWKVRGRYNAEAFANRVKKDITDLTLLGKSPTEIISKIKSDCGVSYYEAKRLITTEASYSFNQANLQRYKDMGADGLWIYTNGSNVCPICESYEGKKYPLDKAPMIPAHPNCHCCYAPYIEVGKK